MFTLFRLEMFAILNFLPKAVLNMKNNIVKILHLSSFLNFCVWNNPFISHKIWVYFIPYCITLWSKFWVKYVFCKIPSSVCSLFFCIFCRCINILKFKFFFKNLFLLINITIFQRNVKCNPCLLLMMPIPAPAERSRW